MRLLLDTHLLLWVAEGQIGRKGLSREAVALIANPGNQPIFSAASLWEIAIKAAKGRSDFRQDVGALRRGLIDTGYAELPVTSDHAIGVAGLAAIHGDPFDRLLIAQARVEGAVLLTADAKMAAYGEPVRRI